MAVLKIIKRSWVDLNFLIGLFWLENNRGSLCIETDKVTSLDVELISLCNNICAKSKIVEPNKYRIKKKFAKSLECKLNNSVINSRKLFNSSMILHMPLLKCSDKIFEGLRWFRMEVNETKHKRKHKRTNIPNKHTHSDCFR